MNYIHIPVDFQNPTEQDFQPSCTLMAELKDVPVHVHCIANYRVSAFFYRYRRDVLSWDERWMLSGTPRGMGLVHPLVPSDDMDANSARPNVRGFSLSEDQAAVQAIE